MDKLKVTIEIRATRPHRKIFSAIAANHWRQ